MYKLIPAKRTNKDKHHDYEFKDFKSFYDIAPNLLLPIRGRYSVAILSDKIEEISEFIKDESKYSHLLVYIYTSESLIDYMLLRNTGLQVESQKGAFETFKNLITEKKLLFDKDVISVLYASIEHDFASMDAALTLLVTEYGPQVLIKESMLAELFVINKVIFPRQVLMAYLRGDRYRSYKLDKCIEGMGNDVVLGAFVKNIKTIVEEKATYFKTGKCKEYVKQLDTKNVTLMYRVLVAERAGLNDIRILLELYERGLSTHDIVKRATN